ncbi:MAG: hypothetical protein WAK17_24265 [Candidatus Nitrosopolaris sp.]
MRTHIKILHKALQWNDCEDCKTISVDVDEDILAYQRVSMDTLKKLKEHIKVLHDFERSPLSDGVTG